MIQAQKLTKLYGTFPAIIDVTFSVSQGEIVGLLGPNGAGKTTTLRILACILAPSSGSAQVAGFCVQRQSLQVRRHLGYMPENISPYPEMMVATYLDFVGKMKGMRGKERRTQVEKVLTELSLTEVARQYIGTLSKGFRQRVGLAQALIHDPGVLILDEPTLGLDPEQAADFRHLVRSLRGKRTIILSTHILPEVQVTCDRVMIIHRGRLLALDTPENLTARLRDTSEVLVQVDGPPSEVQKALSELPGVLHVQLHRQGENGGATYVVTASKETDIRPVVGEAILRHGWQLYELRARMMDLEEIFHRVVESEDRQA